MVNGKHVYDVENRNIRSTNHDCQFFGKSSCIIFWIQFSNMCYHQTLFLFKLVFGKGWDQVFLWLNRWLLLEMRSVLLVRGSKEPAVPYAIGLNNNKWWKKIVRIEKLVGVVLHGGAEVSTYKLHNSHRPLHIHSKTPHPFFKPINIVELVGSFLSSLI